MPNDPRYISDRLPDALESGSYKIVIKTPYSKPQLLSEQRLKPRSSSAFSKIIDCKKVTSLFDFSTMEIAKEYITDESGSIKSVVIDFTTFRAIEEALLDQGLEDAMLEVQDDEELTLSEAMKLTQ
mgnify:CR=1 FL=1